MDKNKKIEIIQKLADLLEEYDLEIITNDNEIVIRLNTDYEELYSTRYSIDAQDLTYEILNIIKYS